MTYHEEYDPDLHGGPEQTPPHANRALALAVTLVIVGVPLIVWWLL